MPAHAPVLPVAAVFQSGDCQQPAQLPLQAVDLAAAAVAAAVVAAASGADSSAAAATVAAWLHCWQGQAHALVLPAAALHSHPCQRQCAPQKKLSGHQPPKHTQDHMQVHSALQHLRRSVHAPRPGSHTCVGSIIA